MPIKNFMNVYHYFEDTFKYLNFKKRYTEVTEQLNKQKEASYKKKRLLAVYDYIDMVHSNDISNFILQAEITRRINKLEKIDLLVISDEHYPLNAGCNPTVTTENHKHIIYNLVIEYTRLFDTIGSFIVLDNRNQAIDYIHSLKKNYYQLFPYDYNPNFPLERIHHLDRPIAFHISDYDLYAKADPTLNFLSPPSDQIQLANKWLKKFAYPKIPITISLRETISAANRNSKIENWQKFIDYYRDDSRYIFIIIRDYYQVFEEDNIVGENVIYCNEATISLSFRAALYQQSTLSLFVGNGVAMLGCYNLNVNYIMLRMGIEKMWTNSRKAAKEIAKLNYLDNWHGSTKYQKIVWDDDTSEIINTEFQAMIKKLELDKKLKPKAYVNQVTPIKTNYDINHAIYNTPNIMSTRIPIWVYKCFFKIFNQFKSDDKISICSSLDEIDFTIDTKIILYGAGTISKSLIPKYKEYISFIIDANYDNLEKKELDGIQIKPLDDITLYNFDYIFISPKNRELNIIELLSSYYNIPTKKLLVLNKRDIEMKFKENRQ